MGAWNSRVQASPNHAKSLGNKLQGPCERNTAFSTSFSLILGSSGKANFTLRTLFFDKKAVPLPNPSSPGGVWPIFCFFFRLFDLPGGPRDSFLSVFLRFYLVKLQFSKKNVNFTCIRAIPDVCYAGTNAIPQNKHHVYLHNRPLGWILGAWYAGKSIDLRWELNFYLHNRHLIWLLCR